MWSGVEGRDLSGMFGDSLVKTPGVCGIPLEAQLQMDTNFHSSARDLRFCKNNLRGLYRDREELNNKLAFNQVQIDLGKDEERKAMRVFRARHRPIAPDATDRDIAFILGIPFIEGTCINGPLTKPGGPLYDVLAGSETVFAGPSIPSTPPPHLGSARLVSSTAGPVVRRTVRVVPPLLPLIHARQTAAFNAGNNDNNNLPVEAIRPLKTKRLVKKSVLTTSRGYSGKHKYFWKTTFSKRPEDSFPDLLASIK